MVCRKSTFANMYCGDLVVFSNISVLNLCLLTCWNLSLQAKCSNLYNHYYYMKFMGFGKDGEQVHKFKELVCEGVEGP